MKLLLATLLLLIPQAAQAEYLGNLSANEFDPNSVANPFDAGNPFSPNSVTNEFGIYGNPFSNQSATNPYATDAPRLYDQQGHDRGKLTTNQFDPDSTSNPYGRYGSPPPRHIWACRRLIVDESLTVKCNHFPTRSLLYSL